MFVLPFSFSWRSHLIWITQSVSDPETRSGLEFRRKAGEHPKPNGAEGIGLRRSAEPTYEGPSCLIQLHRENLVLRECFRQNLIKTREVHHASIHSDHALGNSVSDLRPSCRALTLTECRSGGRDCP